MKHYKPGDDLNELLLRWLGQIERGISALKLGGTFILLIVFCDYLVDMGWFSSDLQRLSRR
jgi:hypothetical protein